MRSFPPTPLKVNRAEALEYGIHCRGGRSAEQQRETDRRATVCKITTILRSTARLHRMNTSVLRRNAAPSAPSRSQSTVTGVDGNRSSARRLDGVAVRSARHQTILQPA